MPSYDLTIIGGGIVGLATARALHQQDPARRLAVVEKEPHVGRHQTGHNSGVIHAGLYYRPGSLKARLCVEGGRLLTGYCDDRAIPYSRCGKVVVATTETQLPALDELYRRGTANGIPGLIRLDATGLHQVEPYAAGIAAIHSPHTGIIDFGRVARSLAADLQQSGVDILTNHQLLAIDQRADSLRLTTSHGHIDTASLVNCGGLHADRVARLMGIDPPVRLVPFRGEYYLLHPDRANLVRGLIYPVPDPDLPFLGVHLTRTIDGGVEAGPNAVLALAREGYTRTAINLPDLRDMLTYPGFWRMARRWWRTGIAEYHRSFRKSIFLRDLQQLLPALTAANLIPGGAGVRAQAVTPTGALADDFVITQSPHSIHVLNAPSPAATASLAIGQHIATLIPGA